MDAFIHQQNPMRVVFGAGVFQQLGREMQTLHLHRALVLSTPGQRVLAEQVAQQLGQAAAGVFAQATMHVPVEVVRSACDAAARARADCCIAIGGGSTIGLAKAVALQAKESSPIVTIAIPTTYAGSEMTPIWGITQDGVKKTGRDARVLPRSVLYDPQLTLTLPYALTVTSLFNAIAHAAEGLYAHDTSPLLMLYAEEGIRACAQALIRLQTQAENPHARHQALYGAWLCACVLGHTAMGLHHKLCHTLGGSFNLPHADVHTVVLPHALAYNARHAPVAMQRIARALGAQGNAVQALCDLAQRCGAPTSLAAIGMPAAGLTQAADLAVSVPYPNPRPLVRDALRALLQRAWEGSAPQEG